MLTDYYFLWQISMSVKWFHITAMNLHIVRILKAITYVHAIMDIKAMGDTARVGGFLISTNNQDSIDMKKTRFSHHFTVLFM